MPDSCGFNELLDWQERIPGAEHGEERVRRVPGGKVAICSTVLVHFFSVYLSIFPSAHLCLNHI